MQCDFNVNLAPDSMSFFYTKNIPMKNRILSLAVLIVLCCACHRKSVTNDGGTVITVNFGSKIAEGDIRQSLKVIKKRLHYYGVENPKVIKEGEIYKIMLPLQNDTSTMKLLVASGGRLEIFQTYESREVFQEMNRINKIISGLFFDKKIAAKFLCPEKNFFFCNNLIPGNLNIRGPVVGYAGTENLPVINNMLDIKEVKDSMNPQIAFRWTIDEVSENFAKKLKEECNDYDSKSFFTLIAVRRGNDGKASLGGADIDQVEAASVTTNDITVNEIRIGFTKNAATTWAEVTNESIGKSIAFVIDGKVYAYPAIQTKITSGNVAISGDFSFNEAKAISALIKFGEMPLVPTIVKTDLLIK